jgi:filamentous hemagglutinin family protein
LSERLLVSTALAGLVCLAGTPQAYANPTGGQVVGGTATISSVGNTLTVQQTSSNAIINWNSFNIAAGETTRFQQPSANSIALNRVTGTQNPSQILGQLTANGQVWIINPNGVMFGNGAQVNVAGLVATTANISDGNFMAGDYTFSHPGNPNATVSNAGSITTADAGLVAFVAPNVSNAGLIEAKLGKVQLGSGDTFALDLYGDGLISLQAGSAVTQQIVNNSGVIQANGGTVTLTAAAAQDTVNSLINNSGVIEARSVGQQNGQIVLYAEGSNAVANNDAMRKGTKTGSSTVLVSGVLDASGYGTGQTGGKISALGDNVALLDGSLIDASGDLGGGAIRIGGAYQGKGDTPAAKRLVVQGGATLRANAGDKGDGGEAILWADERTDFAGTVEAKAGASGGNGGFVETSGKEILQATGLVDASAPGGKAGTWLLDPNNVTIQSAGSDTNVSGSPNFTTTDDSAIVTTGSIQTALNAGTSVTVQTGAAGTNAQSGDITVASNIAKSAGGDATLTLKAHNTITVNGNVGITSTSNKLNVVLNADSDASGAGAIVMNSGSSIASNGGNITLGGGADPTTTAAFGDATNVSGVYLDSTVQLQAGGGNISLIGSGYGSTGYGVYSHFNNSIQTTGSGAITINGTSTSTNSYGVRLRPSTTAGSGISAVNGDINITGTGGGIHIYTGNIASTGSGNISIVGTGGGIYMTTSGTTQISSTGTGSITLQGTGTSGGIRMNGSSIISSVSGDISLIGNGLGGGAWDILLFNGGSAITSTGSANITLEAQSSGGIWEYAPSTPITIGGASDSGNIKFITDSTYYPGTGYWSNMPIQTTGNVTFQPYTASTTIGVNGATGNLQLTSAILDNITASTLTIGRNDGTGLMRVAGYDASARNWNLNLFNGSGNIQFDGGGTALKLASNKNVSATTTTGDITAPTATGTIQTQGSGTITLTAGGNINETNALALTTAGGAVSLYGSGDITESGAITTNGGNVLLNSDRDASGAGAISLGGAITSGGGNITLGGGSGTITGAVLNADGSLNTAATGFARGDATIAQGVILGAHLNAAGGNIIVNGTGYTQAAVGNAGVLRNNGTTIQTSGSGSVNISGTGGGNSSSSSNYGIHFFNANNITTGSGNIILVGAAGAGTTQNYGIYAFNSTLSSTSGNINLLGTSANGTGSFGLYLQQDTFSTGGTGNITLYGTAGTVGGNGSHNIFLQNGASVISTGSGTITLTGAADLSTLPHSSGIVIGGSGSSTIGGASYSGTIVISDYTLSMGSQTIQTTGNVILKPFSTSTTIGLGSATGTFGITSGILDSITAGTVTLGRSDGTGLMRVAGYDASARNWGLSLLNGSGNIQFDGSVGGSPSALTLASGKTFSATTTTSGDITSSAAGSLVTSGTGTITLSAGHDINFTNAIGMSLNGSGAATLRANNSIIYTSGGTITTQGGAITINSDRDASGAGAIDLNNYAVLTSNGGNITLGGGADPTTTAAYGTASNQQGIYLGGTNLAAGGGNIILRGTGWSDATADSAAGVEVYSNTVSTTGSGSIAAVGAGGSGTRYGVGFRMDNASHLSVADGDINITGTGANAGGSSYYNQGVLLDNSFGGGYLRATGNGNINIAGTGGSGTGGGHFGVQLGSFSGTLINTVNGDINITGTGGANNGGFGSAYGIYMTGAPATYTNGVYTTGTGNITFTGNSPTTGATGISATTTGGTRPIGGASDNGNISFVADTISLANTSIQSLQNLIFKPYTASTTIGVAGATGSLQITSGILGAITANTLTIGRNDGTGLMRVAGYDASSRNWNLNLLNGSGNIQFDGSVGGSPAALTMANNRSFSTATTSSSFVTSTNGTITTTGTGGITIDDPMTLGGHLTLSTGNSGTMTFGSTVNGSYNLTATAGTLSFASPLGGTTPLSAVSLTSTSAVTLPSITAASLLARATGASSDLTVANGSRLTASGSNTAITLVAARNFINSEGSDALATPSGRWLVYSTNPANDTIGGLANDFRRFTCTYGGSCPSFPAGGNGFLYSYTPTLTATPTGGVSLTYGDAVPNLSGYSHTLSGYLGSDSGSDSVTGSLNGATPYTQGSSVGSYAINYSSGSLSSALGYGFSYANNGTGISVGQRAVTITAGDQTHTYGFGSLGTTGFSLTSGSLYGTDNISGVTLSTNDATSASGNYKVTASPATITPSAAVFSSGSSGNYAITYANAGTGLTVNPATLNVTGFAVSDKTYDGTTTAAITSNGSLSGVVGGDAVALNSSGASATFDNRNAGTTHTVTASGYTLSGAEAGNYTFTQPAAVNVSIFARGLTVTANPLSYTYADTLGTLTYSNSGLGTGDSFTGALTTAHGGAGIVLKHANGFDVSGSPFVITQGTLTVNDGNGGNNYSITYNSANVTLLAKALSVLGFTVADKTYDGTTAATISADGSLVGVVAGDTVSLNNASAWAAFASKNAGTATASATGYTLSGAQAGNYTLNQPTASATISPALLAVTASNESKKKGAADPALAYTYSGLVDGDTSASFSGGLTRDAGENVGSYAIRQGTLAATGNYSISTFADGAFSITAASSVLPSTVQGVVSQNSQAAPPQAYQASGSSIDVDSRTLTPDEMTQKPGDPKRWWKRLITQWGG